MCFSEKIHVVDKLLSGMSNSAVGHELKINKSTTSVE
jgi:DNA-binding NarL/FixJ family response regulator